MDAAPSFTAGMAAAYTERLDNVIPQLFQAMTVPSYRGGSGARTWRTRLAITDAFLRAAARRSLSRRRGFRTQREVHDIYNRRWASPAWSTARSAEKLFEYNSNLYVVNDKEPFGNWFYVLALAELIRLVKPKRVLEIGSGRGFNSNSLALLFPRCQFAGLELTPAGVKSARQLRADTAFIDHVGSQYRPLSFASAKAIDNAIYTIGDAQRLPFADASFDLVFSVLAVEQMNPIKVGVFREVARVTRCLSAHIEPFADFNGSPFRRMHLASKDYFRSRIRLLDRCGLRPLCSWDRFPQKMYFSAGIVVSEKVRHGAQRDEGTRGIR